MNIDTAKFCSINGTSYQLTFGENADVIAIFDLGQLTQIYLRGHDVDGIPAWDLSREFSAKIPCMVSIGGSLGNL